MTGRVLSTRALNRALLARQLLLERSALPLVRALEQVAGYRSLVFNARTPHSVGTFLVDGAVAGVVAARAGTGAAGAVRPLARRARRDLDEEAERLAAFHAD